ncbi:FDLD family class I lanthipeptide [Pseudonocardia sp. DLS-67]
MPTETLAPADFDLDIEVAVVVEPQMSAQKTGVTDICTTIYWPCQK